MYRHELYKIFTKKSIYIVLLLSIIMLIYGNRVISSDETLKGEKYDLLFEEWGGPLTDEKLEKAKEFMELSDSGEKRFPREEGRVHTLVGVAGINSFHLEEQKEYLRAELEVLDDKSYKQKEMTKELNMLQKLDKPFGFYLIRAWHGMFEFIEPYMSVIFLSTLIVLGITPLFTDEYSSRTINLMLATKNGKRKIVTAKMYAMITYITIVFIILHLVNFIIHYKISGGISGGNSPMQNLYLWSWTNYSTSPFKWNLIEFYMIALGIQYIAAIFIGILVMFLSIIFKNTMLTLLSSAMIIGAPSFFGQLSEGKGFLAYIDAFNYAELLKSSSLFVEFNAYNVFGIPILYPVLIMILFFVITTALFISVYRLHQKTEISY